MSNQNLSAQAATLAMEVVVQIHQDVAKLAIDNSGLRDHDSTLINLRPIQTIAAVSPVMLQFVIGELRGLETELVNEYNLLLLPTPPSPSGEEAQRRIEFSRWMRRMTIQYQLFQLRLLADKLEAVAAGRAQNANSAAANAHGASQAQ